MPHPQSGAFPGTPLPVSEMAEEAEERGHGAILSADVGGEEARELAGERVRSCGGGIVEVPGERVLAAFPAALEAAQCALEIQGALDARNAELPLARVAAFRIGVHLGDVLGDGIEIAMALESLATPGGICVSGPVHDQIAAVLAVRFEDLGPRDMEGKQVHAWRVQGTEAKRRPAERWTPRGLALPIAAGLALGAVTALLLWVRPATETETASAPAARELRLELVETFEALVIGVSYDAGHEAALARAGATTQQALAQVPDSALARSARALVYLGRREHRDAVAEADRALALEPDTPMSHRVRAAALAYSGRPFEALEAGQRARELDPRTPAVYVIEGRSYRQLGRREDAIDAFERAVAESPDNRAGLAALVVLYGEADRAEDAERAVARLRELQPDFSGAAYAAALPFADPLDAERLAQGLARAGLP